MNIKKTKIMVMSKESRDTEIKIDASALERVTSYVYLRQTITNGKSDNEILKRIGIAKARFGKMKCILTSQHLDPKTRMRMVKCYVHSALLYGSETWTINKKMEDKICAFEMWTYRRMAKVSWTERKTTQKCAQC